ncbi:hypothetical protein BH23BAC1_BH23BAC1_28660 [soil metagenome]
METLKLKSPSFKNFNLEAESISHDFFDKPFIERSEFKNEPVIETAKEIIASDAEYDIIIKISEFEKTEYKWPLELLTE